MTGIFEHSAGGTSRSLNLWPKCRGTGRLFASFSLVFVIAAFLWAGCDDEAQIAREKESAAIKSVIRQVEEINLNLPAKQPESYGEKENAYRAIVEKCCTDLKKIDISLCPLTFQHFFERYVQAVDDLFRLCPEKSEKKGFDERCEKRNAQFLLIKMAKDDVKFIASDYGVMVQIGEPASKTEGGEPSPEGKAPSSPESSANNILIPNDLPKELQGPVKHAVAQAVNQCLEDGKFASKEDVRAVQTLTWIIGGVLLFWGMVCLVFLVLIFNRAGMPLRLNGKNVEANQTADVAKDRNDLMLEIAEQCYRHGEYSECVRHLVNAKRLGVKEAERMYSRYLDDSKDFREAADVYQFLEKQPRPS